jgi:hypothetical protein
MPMVNLPLFGAIAYQSGTVALDEVLEIVREVAAKRGNVDAYVTAATRGFKEVKIAGAKEATVR